MNDTTTETYWSRFPDTYDQNVEYVVGKELIDEITRELDRLPELGELAELGCGTGLLTEAVMVKATSMVATDLSDDLLAVAETRIGDRPNVTVQRRRLYGDVFPL